MRTAWIARLLLLAGSLAAGGLLVEAALRAGIVDNPRHAYLQSDGETHDPVARLLLLGDSFIDKRTGGGFHRALVERLGPAGYELVNLGVSGTGPEDYLATWRAHGQDVQPDWTIVFYFAGNDLINVLRYRPPRATGPLAGLRDALRPWVHRLYLYHAATAHVGQAEFDFDAMLADGHDPDLVARARTGELNPWLLLIPADVRARYLATNLELDSPEWRRGEARLTEILEALARETEGAGSQMLVVVFPATTQVSRSHFDFYERAGFDPDPRTLTASAPQDMLERIGARLGVPVLDLLPLFRAEADRDLYRPYDSHLSEHGNALAAGAVAAFVRRHAAGAGARTTRAGGDQDAPSG